MRSQNDHGRKPFRTALAAGLLLFGAGMLSACGEEAEVGETEIEEEAGGLEVEED